MHGVGSEFVAALQEGQFDQDGDADHLSAERFDEAGAGLHRSAGRQDVVDQQDAIAGLDGVGVNLEDIGPVFEGVSLAASRCGKLSGFADRNEARRKVPCDGGSEDEPARLGAGDDLDVHRAEGLREVLDREGQAGLIAEHRGDVLEDDPRFREVGDVADQVSQPRQFDRAFIVHVSTFG